MCCGFLKRSVAEKQEEDGTEIRSRESASSQDSYQRFIPFCPLGHDVFKLPWESGSSKKGACIPKNTEAKHIPDIQHMLGSGSLLQIVKV